MKGTLDLSLKILNLINYLTIESLDVVVSITIGFLIGFAVIFLI